MTRGQPEKTVWQVLDVPLDQMARMGKCLALSVEPGLVISLEGELGAGKTTFVRNLCGELGIPPAEVSSPTYVLVHEYAGRLPVFHFDAYRLADADGFAQLGVEEYFDGGGISLVEWGNLVESILPDDRLTLRLAHNSRGTRNAIWTAAGAKSVRTLDRTRKQWGVSEV